MIQFSASPLLGLMVLVAGGYILGRTRIARVTPGPAAGTLLLALALGRSGLSLESLYGNPAPTLTLGSFGFALFIYSVGFEAGPRFFSSLSGRSGWGAVLVAVAVNSLAVATAIACGTALSLSPEATAGMLAGALTSAPTYAAATEFARDPSQIAISFAASYPFGLIGLVTLLHTLPRLLGQKLTGGLTADDEPDDLAGGRQGRRRADAPPPEVTRAFRVSLPSVCGPTLAELALIRRTGCVISHVLHGDAVTTAHAGHRLELGDTMLVTGRLDELRVFAELVGPEVDETGIRQRLPRPRRVLVERAEVIGRPLSELALTRRFQTVVTRIERGAELVEPMPEVTLERGDVVEIAGERDWVRAAASELGRLLTNEQRTNIAVYAAGIVLGLLLGAIRVHPAGLDLGLGNAGGLLVAGLLLGRFPRIGPFDAHVPRAARQLVRDLGILLFVAEAGVDAGHSLAGGVGDLIWRVVAGGIVVTVVPSLLTLLVADRILRLRAVDSWGSLCGGMTSSAALHAVRNVFDSNEPAISYAVAYTVASILVTIAGPVVLYIMRA